MDSILLRGAWDLPERLHLACFAGKHCRHPMAAKHRSAKVASGQQGAEGARVLISDVERIYGFLGMI